MSGIQIYDGPADMVDSHTGQSVSFDRVELFMHRDVEVWHTNVAARVSWRWSGKASYTGPPSGANLVWGLAQGGTLIRLPDGRESPCWTSVYIESGEPPELSFDGIGEPPVSKEVPK